MTAAPVALYQPFDPVTALIDWVKVGATVSCLMPLMVAVAVEVLPATSVTVMPTWVRPLPSLKVNGAGVVTPERELATYVMTAGPVLLLYQPVPAELLIDCVRVGAVV